MRKSTIKKVLCGFFLLVILLIFQIYHFVTLQSYLENFIVDDFEFSRNYDFMLTREEAEEDLDIMWKGIKAFHIAYKDDKKKEIFNKLEKQYKEERKKIENNVSVGDLWKASSKVAAILQDAHTRIEYMPAKEVYTTMDDDLENVEITHINEIPLEILLKAYKNQNSFELESAVLFDFRENLTNVDTLKDSESLHFEAENFILSDNSCQEYMDLSKSDSSYELYEDLDIGVFVLNKCETTNETINRIEQFFIEMKHLNIHNLAIDLRNNAGGDSSVIDEFMKYINVDSYYRFHRVRERDGIAENTSTGKLIYTEKKQPQFYGNIYIMTSNKTFSSATLFAMVVQDNNIGKVIGEIPRNKPTGYGDIIRIQLPNSKLGLCVSKKYFERVDVERNNEPLTPDIIVESEEAKNKIIELISQ